MTQKELGERLRQLREDLGISQMKMALLVDLTTGHYSMLESGERCPNLDTLNRIAKGLGITLAELLQEDKPAVTKHDKISNEIMAYTLALHPDARKHAAAIMKAFYDAMK